MPARTTSAPDFLELIDDGGEVGLGLFDGQAAEAVVAAELYDDDFGVAGEDEVETLEAVLGGVAGDAGVDDVVVVALGVEEALEVVGVGLADVGAEACGEGVAEAEDRLRGVLRGRRGLRWDLRRWALRELARVGWWVELRRWFPRYWLQACSR